MSHGAMVIASGFCAVTPDIVQTQPMTAVTTRMPKSATVFRTVSSTVMRPVSTAPADGAAKAPSSWAFTAASAACAEAVLNWVWAAGGVSPGRCSWNAGLANAGLLLEAMVVSLQYEGCRRGNLRNSSVSDG